MVAITRRASLRYKIFTEIHLFSQLSDSMFIDTKFLKLFLILSELLRKHNIYLFGKLHTRILF